MWRKKGSQPPVRPQPALPQGIETNPQVTKQYSVEDLLKILSGAAPIPEEGMFTGGPLRARYYEEQCLRNTEENSVYHGISGVKTKTSSRRRFFEDFDEARTFSINVSQSNVCSGGGGGSSGGSSGHPLQDISNINIENEEFPRPLSSTEWRPSSSASVVRTKRKVKFFLDTEPEEEEDYRECEVGFVDETKMHSSAKKVCFKDLAFPDPPPTPVFEQHNSYLEDYGPLF